MRDWINLFENVRPMEPRDYSVYTGKTIDHDPDNASLDIMGEDREGMTTEEAKAYLDQHPNGTLHNEIFDRDSFITLDKNGQYVFWHGTEDRAMSWDWAEAEDMIENDQDRQWLQDWWYHSGDQMEVTNGGANWWFDLRSGKYTTAKPRLG